MKKIISLVMASAVALSLFGCSKETGSDQSSSTESDKSSDGKVSVWLPISKTNYHADGSKGFSTYTYTYTDKGLPLTTTQDRGIYEQVWNDEVEIFEYTLHPFDGTVDTTIEYFYNDQGDILYYTNTIYTYENGEVVNKDVDYYGNENQIKYHYDSKGNIESVDFHSLPVGSHVASDEVSSVLHHRYDDNGNLMEIYSESKTNGNIFWQKDFRYDEANRIIASTHRMKEYCSLYQYSYDSNGRLSDVTLSHGHWQTPLDDQQFSTSTAANNASAFSEMSAVHFNYDSEGRLISRQHSSDDEQTVECTYDSSGKLSTITYADAKYVYTDNEADADDTATTLVRDKHGNIVKIIDPDGDYVAIEYQEFRLSEEDAAKCQNVQLALDCIDPTGYTLNSHFKFSEGYASLIYLPLTQLRTVLHETDVLHNKS